MKEQEILEARKREFKDFMADRTENSEEKEKNWYYQQEWDECCDKCKHAEDDMSLIIGERYMCPHCGDVDWNGWCKKFTMRTDLRKNLNV